MQEQKEIFLAGEADAWFDRNHAAIEDRNYGLSDPVVKAVAACLGSTQGGGQNFGSGVW
jgi:hypothetical protein